MNHIFEFMLRPLAACLVLGGLHAYFGLHVVKREIIFVDLALAQIAALGAITAFLFGHGIRSDVAFLFSLCFTFFGAAVFSLTRFREADVPQEAVIGIIYVVSAAVSILVADRAPQGAEHIKEMLVGNILVVSWPEILKVTILYSLIGLFHWAFRGKFTLISFDLEKALSQGISLRWWDFLFYLSFGLMVTYSVAMAGVLLVFSFLIIPAVGATLFSQKVSYRMAIAWCLVFFASLLGIILSFQFDLPTGATLVSTFGLVLLLCGVMRLFAS